MRRRGLLALGLMLSLTGCHPGGKDTPAKDAAATDAAAPKEGNDEKQPTAAVQAVRAVAATLVDRPKLAGNVVPLPGHVASVSTTAAARVLWLGVAPGAHVHAGQVLARLAPDPQAYADAEKAHVAAAQAAREVARLTRLVAGGVAPRVQLEQARAALDTARLDEQARATAYRLAQGNTALEAPIDGVVTQMAAVRGQVADPATALFTLSRLDEVGVEVDLPAGAAGRLQAGDRAEVQPDGGSSSTARVLALPPAVEAATQRRRVLLACPNPRGVLAPGQFVDVWLDLGRRSAIVLPATAFVPRDVGTVAYVVVQGVAKERHVKTRPAADGTEVVAGIQPGDLVVTTGAYVLTDGLKVDVRP